MDWKLIGQQESGEMSNKFVMSQSIRHRPEELSKLEKLKLERGNHATYRIPTIYSFIKICKMGL